MNKTLLYYSFLAASAVVLETTSAASASRPADKKSPGSVLADNFKLLNVAGDDGRPSSTFLKTSSFFSKQLTKILGGGGTLLEPFNAAYDVSITEDFLSESEIRHYRREGSRLDTARPAVGFSGDRTVDTVFVPRQILRRLINKGAEQCMSQEYEDTLPVGVHILTNHVKETTDPHVDVNPVTLERIQNDVAVVFLNTNEDATFVVGKYGIPIEAGKLLMFPGGSVPHSIKMKKQGGFVHMLGPLEVGGSHGIVGQAPRQPKWPDSRFLSIWSSSGYLLVNEAEFTPVQVQGTGSNPNRALQGGDEAANTSSADADIIGKITVTGFIDGIEPDLGQKNTTFEVQYNFTGCNGKCSVFKVKQDPNFCDEVAIGESGGDDIDGDIDITIDDVKNFDLQSVEGAQERGMYYIDVNTSIHKLVDRPIAVHADDGRVLACAKFKEIKSKFPIKEEETPMDDKNSGAISSFSTALVFLVASIVVIAAAL